MLRGLAALAVLGLLGATAAGFAARLGHPFELFSHFRPHWAAAGVLLAPAALLVRQRRAAGALAALALVNAGAVIAGVGRAVPALPVEAEPDLVLVWANLQYNEDALDHVAALARRSEADIVALTELPPGASNWTTLLPGLPCVSVPDYRDIFSIALITRAPCRTAETASPAVWCHAARFTETPDGARIIALHPVPPMTPDARAHRDAVTHGAVETAQRRNADIIVGDFNATPWSPLMIDVRRAGFRPIDCGAPWRSTWRRRQMLTGLPIDLAYAGPRVRRARCRVGADTGSDHYPLIIALELDAQ